MENTVLYPVAKIRVKVDGMDMEVNAAVSETLPVDVVLGKDMPKFYDLLNGACSRKEPQGDAMVVMTHAQMQKQKEQEEEIHHKEEKSGAKTKKVEEWMQTFDKDIFEGGHNNVRQTRSQKRQQRHAYAEEIAQEEMLDTDQSHVIALHPLDTSAGEPKVLQAADTTLDAVRREADENLDAAGAGYFWKNGLLFRKWIPRGRDKQDMTNEQLILPMQCRNMVL